MAKEVRQYIVEVTVINHSENTLHIVFINLHFTCEQAVQVLKVSFILHFFDVTSSRGCLASFSTVLR